VLVAIYAFWLFGFLAFCSLASEKNVCCVIYHLTSIILQQRLGVKAAAEPVLFAVTQAADVAAFEATFLQ
jgi:hypothetical protein